MSLKMCVDSYLSLVLRNGLLKGLKTRRQAAPDVLIINQSIRSLCAQWHSHSKAHCPNNLSGCPSYQLGALPNGWPTNLSRISCWMCLLDSGVQNRVLSTVYIHVQYHINMLG